MYRYLRMILTMLCRRGLLPAHKGEPLRDLEEIAMRNARANGSMLCKGIMLVVVAAWLGGCASTKESAGADTKLTGNIGNYPPAPQGVAKPRVGVPPWKVTTTGGFGGG